MNKILIPFEVSKIALRKFSFSKARSFISFSKIYRCHGAYLAFILHTQKEKYICLISPEACVSTLHPHFNIFTKLHALRFKC